MCGLLECIGHSDIMRNGVRDTEWQVHVFFDRSCKHEEIQRPFSQSEKLSAAAILTKRLYRTREMFSRRLQHDFVTSISKGLYHLLHFRFASR